MCVCTHVRVCVCMSFHKGEIHYSDNESIWDNMRQFTSPVIVSSICGEDGFPARSQRTSSSASASLACSPTAAAAALSPIQEQHRERDSEGLCLHPWGRAVLFSGGGVLSASTGKTGSGKSSSSLQK